MRWTCYSLQTLSIVLGYGMASTPFMIFIMLVISVYQARIPLAVLLTYTFVMSLLSLPLAIGMAIALKWLVIRRYKPGRYPLWGFYYFRWWLATRVQSVSGMMLFEGTPLMSLFYRLMGRRWAETAFSIPRSAAFTISFPLATTLASIHAPICSAIGWKMECS